MLGYHTQHNNIPSEYYYRILQSIHKNPGSSEYSQYAYKWIKAIKTIIQERKFPRNISLHLWFNLIYYFPSFNTNNFYFSQNNHTFLGKNKQETSLILSRIHCITEVFKCLFCDSMLSWIFCDFNFVVCNIYIF